MPLGSAAVDFPESRLNYFEKHVGDWIKDTVSLSMLEEGAYNRMIDQCYQTEQPLPLDTKEIYRAARATSVPERRAVDYVLRRYFIRTADGFVQKRVQAEISRFQAKQSKAQASANARWSKGKSDANAYANAYANASPIAYANADPNGYPNAMLEGMQNGCSVDALQTPDTKHQEPEREVDADASPSSVGKTRRKGRPVRLRTWLTALADRGEPPIGESDPVWQHAERLKLPPEFIALAWRVFEAKHLEGEKTYIDWRAAFRNHIDGGWLKLWHFATPDGSAALTTAGISAQRLHGEPPARNGTHG